MKTRGVSDMARVVVYLQMSATDELGENKQISEEEPEKEENVNMKMKIGISLLAVCALSVFLAAGLAGAAGPECAVPGVYATIQGAINDSNCTTINVAAGTYHEQITIRRPVIINGADGAVLDGTGLSGWTTGVKIKSGNVTFNNINVTNFTQDGIIIGYEASTPGSLKNVRISNCKISNIQPGYWGFGIYAGYEAEAFKYSPPKLTAHLDYSGLLIENNEITNTKSSGLVLQSITGTTDPIVVRNNHFHSNATNDAIWVDTARNILIENNTIANNLWGIDITSIGDAYNGSGYNWGNLNGAWGPKDITIKGNAITDNQEVGIAIYDGYPATTFINQNSITGNTMGVENYLIEPVDATNNWWGDSTGPLHQTSWTYGAVTVGPNEGSGNEVSDYVLYAPYFTGISYTGDVGFLVSENVVLQAFVENSEGPVQGILVEFYVDGGFVGSALTDASGLAAFDWGMHAVGTYAVEVRCLGGQMVAHSSIMIGKLPRDRKQQVLDELVALYATITDKEDRARLKDAIEHLQKSLAADRWLDASHPKPGTKGEGVFNEEKPVVLKLRELRKANDSGLSAALMQSYIDQLLATDRLLAEIALEEAIARGGKADRIKKAREALFKGDVEAGKDHPDKAIEHYKNAWKNAIAA